MNDEVKVTAELSHRDVHIINIALRLLEGTVEANRDLLRTIPSDEIPPLSDCNFGTVDARLGFNWGALISLRRRLVELLPVQTEDYNA